LKYCFTVGSLWIVMKTSKASFVYDIRPTSQNFQSALRSSTKVPKWLEIWSCEQLPFFAKRARNWLFSKPHTSLNLRLTADINPELWTYHTVQYLMWVLNSKKKIILFIKGKDKAVSVFKWFNTGQRRRMEGVGIAPLFKTSTLIVDEWSATCSWRSASQDNSSCNSLEEQLGGLQRRSGRYRKQKLLLLLPWIES
jgi:hypothetical protein